MARAPSVVWMKKHWHIRENPFPPEAIARLGGDDPRDNGELYDPNVQPEKVAEATEKFVLGAAYSGQKFGFLWSLGSGVLGDARGFGKSSLLQYLVDEVNKDFGERFFLENGLEKADAEEHALCAVMASFDMENARSLNAVFFEATRYACRFRRSDSEPTLAQRIRGRLASRVKSEDPTVLMEAVTDAAEQLRGRTLGPLMTELLAHLCKADHHDLGQYIERVTAAKRARNGALFLATFLVMVKAAGIRHMLLCCDQLEEFASTTTSRQKRTQEIERFRDYLLELQPMSDMLAVVVTMYPRAEKAISDMWRLADLPSYAHGRPENRHCVVILERVSSAARAAVLLTTYLEPYRSEPAPDGWPLFPFTEDAVKTIFTRSDRKPRDILRKAHALFIRGAEENWTQIDGEQAAAVLESFKGGEEEDLAVAGAALEIPDEVWDKE